MGTIKDLAVEYGKIQEELKRVRGNYDPNDKNGARQISQLKSKADKKQQTIRDAEIVIATFSITPPTTTDEQKKLNDALQSKKEAEDELGNIIKILNEKTDPNRESTLKDLRRRQIGILTQLASNPDVNRYLIDYLRADFAKSISKIDTSIQDLKKDQNDFNAALLDDSILGKEATAVKTAYENWQRVKSMINENTTAPVEQARLAKAKQDYTIAATALRSATDAKFSNKTIVISDDQMVEIASGPVTGKYNIQVLGTQIAIGEAEKANLQQQEKDVIEKMEAAKTLSASADVSKIDADITAKDGEIQANQAAIKVQQDEVKKAQDALDAISNNSGELTRLEGLIKVDPAKEQAVIDAEKEVKTHVDASKKAGYISAITIPELKDDKSVIAKAYVEFEKRDLALRKAFLRVQGENTQEAKANLIKAIQEYQILAQALEKNTGYKVEDWNDYLQRRQNQKIENGETIDEAYYASTAESRLEQIRKEYGVNKKDAEYQSVVNQLAEMETLKQQILKGQKTISIGADGKASEIDSMIADYTSAMQGFATSLKENVADLFNRMKSSAMKKIGFFKKLFTWARKKEKLPTREYSDDVLDAVEDLQDAREELEYAKEARNSDVASKKSSLSDEDKNKLQALQAEAAKKSQYEKQKSDAESEITRLKGESTTLVAEKAKLEKDRADAIAAGTGNEITDAYTMARPNAEARKLAQEAIKLAKSKDEDFTR